ncbi:MAG: hypothetical protein CK429_29190 [Mycobacterium sp.]|nr:MAG: hypothetical protein CK429_29190 [Mycobacterium sp.]
MNRMRWYFDGGIHTPKPPEGEDAEDELTMALYYIRHYLDDFTHGRDVNKRKAKYVTVGSACANAAIVIVGALTTLTSWPVLGVVSASIAGLISIVAAWEEILSNRELWIRRSETVLQLNELDRRYRVLALNGQERAALAQAALDELNAVLGAHTRGWTKYRQGQHTSANTPTVDSQTSGTTYSP